MKRIRKMEERKMEKEIRKAMLKRDEYYLGEIGWRIAETIGPALAEGEKYVYEAKGFSCTVQRSEPWTHVEFRAPERSCRCCVSVLDAPRAVWVRPFYLDSDKPLAYSDDEDYVLETTGYFARSLTQGDRAAAILEDWADRKSGN